MSQVLDIDNEAAVLDSGATRSDFIEAASSLGAKICRDAMWSYGRCNWIAPIMEFLGGRWQQVHKVFGPELYGGTSGVALSLAALYDETGERVFKRTALGALRHALSRSEDTPPFARVGLYSGWLGLALAASRVSAVVDDDSLRDSAARLVKSLATSEIDLNNADVLAGVAGAIAAVILLNKELAEAEAPADLAISFGDHLIKAAVKSDRGWSWGELYRPESGAYGNLNGFSHGAGGIGWALLELYHFTSLQRFREAAEAAFAYERSWFDPVTGNWPDLRDPELSGGSRTQGPTYMNAWCHGAPGIALARLRAYEILESDVCREEAEIAIATTMRNLYGNLEMSQTNYSLCHGLGGNCEPLIEGARILRQPELFVKAQEVARRGIESYEKQRLPWPCGGPGNLESPSLMLGYAGISYYYLRMAEPEQTPSLLLFSPRS
jgi:lantibiotic biosynthesis protein